MRIYQEEDKLMIAEGKAKVVIEPWGANSLRVNRNTGKACKR